MSALVSPAVAAAAAAASARYAAVSAAWVAAGNRTPGWGPVFAAKSRSYRVRVWEVYVPQAAPLVGVAPVARFATQAEAEARVAELLAANSYVLDAAGWWRLAA